MLTLCYIFPPLAVLFMGRPFGAMLNMLMIFGGWGNMVRHALLCYADSRTRNYKNDVVGAISGLKDNSPVSRRSSQPAKEPEPELIDHPCVGGKGTVFKQRQ